MERESACSEVTSLVTTTTSARQSAAWSPEERKEEEEMTAIATVMMMIAEFSSLSQEKNKSVASITTDLETRSVLPKEGVMTMMMVIPSGNSSQVSSWVASALPSLSKDGSTGKRSQMPRLKPIRTQLLSKWDPYQSRELLVSSNKLSTKISQ